MSGKTPNWLKESQASVELSLPPGNRDALIELEKQTFEIAFEQALEKMAGGDTLDTFCREYYAPLSPVRFRTWMFRDEKRRRAYYAAKALGAEAIEDELIRIADGIRADGEASFDDTARSTLRINTRKWLLQVNNRKRYGDVKHIEQTTTSRIELDNLTNEQLMEKVLNGLGINGDTFDMEGDYGHE